MWREVKSLIRKNRSFLVTTHVFPDGDAIGSQLALAHALRRLGKKVLLVNAHPVPEVYRFLDPRRSIKTYGRDLAKPIRHCDAAFVLDVSSLARVGAVGDAIKAAGLKIACIDHHVTHAQFADVSVVGSRFAATGEMVYDLIQALGVPVTPRLATCLFVAVATDTGWFRYPNTRPHTLRVAAELMDRGAKTDKIYAAVHERVRWQRMALMKCALETLRSECDGRLAHFCVTQQMMRETGATDEDTDNFSNIPRALGDVQLILFFRELEDGQVKVSLRSKAGPPVTPLAAKHGGGGHARAAGATVPGPLKRAMRAILADARRLVRRNTP